MTLDAKALAWREEQRAKLHKQVTPRPTSKGDARFAPMNALTDGLWLHALSGRECKVWFIL